MFIVDKEAAAATAIGVDLIDGKWYQTAQFPRLLQGLGITGSAAAGDFAADVFVGTVKVGQVINVATGAPTNARDQMVPCSVPIPANVPLKMIVTDPSATNVGWWQIVTTP